MSKLPITQREYDNSVLVADFIHKTRSIFETYSEITEFCFIPMTEGYKISYKRNGIDENVSIKFRKILNGMTIKAIRRNRKKNFCSKTVEDNSVILKKIFD